MLLSRNSRRHLLLACLSVSIIMTAGCATSAEPSHSPRAAVTQHSAQPKPLIVAHRGGADEGAEGSLESLVASAKAGFPVEFDLHPLKDGKWAVAHDAKVDRILKGKSGPVSAMTAAEWRSSCIEGPNGKCGTPATWDDVVGALPRGTHLVPEIKNGEIKPSDMAAAVKRAGLIETTVVQTFRLAEAKELASSGISTLYLADIDTVVDTEAAAAAGIEFIGVNKNSNKAIVQRAHASGLKVWVWTVDDRVVAKAWNAAGSDGIFTDVPKAMRDWLN